MLNLTPEPIWMSTNQWPRFSFNPLDQLQSLGVNVGGLDAQVEDEIETQKVNTISLEEFHKQLDALSQRPEAEWLTDAQIEAYWFDLVKQAWKTIKGVNIDEELWGQEEVVQSTETKQPTSAIWALTQWAWGWLLSGVKTIWEGIEWVVWWAVTSLPKITWNIAWFLVDTFDFLTPDIAEDWWKFDLWGLADQFRKWWIEDTAKLRDITWIDPEALTTTVWELWAEVATLFIPWGQSKLVANFPKVAKEIPWLVKGLETLSKKLPWTYNKLKSVLTSWYTKSAAVWWIEAAKFWVVADWEISPTWVAIWAVSNPVIKLGSAVFTKEAPALLRKITWVNTSQIKKKWIESIHTDEELVTAWLKKLWEKTDNFEGMLNLLNKRAKQIYTKYINPKIAKADKLSWPINLKGTTAWVIDDLSIKIWDTIKYAWWISDDVLKAEIKSFKEIEKWIKSFADLENFKLYVSSQLRGNALPKNIVPLYEKLNKNLQTQYDDLLTKVLWEWKWVTQLKREYAALQNMKEWLYAKVAKELRDTWTSLVEQYWYFGAIWKVIAWDVHWATKDVLTVQILEKLRDPSWNITKFFKALDKTPRSPIKEKIIWGASWKIWEELDEKQITN